MSGKILMVSDKFAPHAGGSAVVMTQWCHHWPVGQVRVVTSKVPGWREYDRAQSLPIQRSGYPNIPKLRMPLLWVGLWSRTAVTSQTWKPSVVHYGQMFGTAFLAPLLGVPYVVNIHGEELTTALGQPLVRRLYDWILGHAVGTTVNSSFTRDVLCRTYGYSGPVLTVHPGVDLRTFHPGDAATSRRHLGLTGSPILLTVARLMRRKGHDMVLQCLPELLVDYPDAEYVIVGDGPERDTINALVERHGLQSRVRFLGRLPVEDLVHAYRAADVFVHPNRQLDNGDVEGFGIVFLEAGACEVPVLGGRSGGTVDAVEGGVSGFLVDPDSPRDILACMRHLLADPELRVRMGRAGRERAATFNWSSAATRVWDFSLQVAKRAGR